MGLCVKIRRLESGLGLALPFYATPGSAGVDLLSSEDMEILPGCRAAVGTGICMEIPEGYEGQVRPRSGLALKNGVTVLNSPGTVDSDYRGEIRVILINTGDETFKISKGSRIAQMIFAPVSQVSFSEEINLASSLRGDGGFGSTGSHISEKPTESIIEQLRRNVIAEETQKKNP